MGWRAVGTKDGTYAGALTTSGEVGSATRTVLFQIDAEAAERCAPAHSAPSLLGERAVEGDDVRERVARHSLGLHAGAFSYRHGRVRSVRIIARDAAGNLSRTLKFP